MFGLRPWCPIFTDWRSKVRKEGLEPTQPFGYRLLRPARLPVPPLSPARPFDAAQGPREPPSDGRQQSSLARHERSVRLRSNPSGSGSPCADARDPRPVVAQILHALRMLETTHRSSGRPHATRDVERIDRLRTREHSDRAVQRDARSPAEVPAAAREG